MTVMTMNTEKTAPFATRHIGITDDDRDKMLSALGYQNVPALLDKVIPSKIVRQSKFFIGEGKSKKDAQQEAAIKCLANIK